MIRPLMMAKRVPPSRVMEVSVKAVTGISVPPASCSALVPVTRAVGTQLMGQNGLRLVTSNSKKDLFLVSMAGELASAFHLLCRPIDGIKEINKTNTLLRL